RQSLSSARVDNPEGATSAGAAQGLQVSRGYSAHCIPFARHNNSAAISRPPGATAGVLPCDIITSIWRSTAAVAPRKPLFRHPKSTFAKLTLSHRLVEKPRQVNRSCLSPHTALLKREKSGDYRPDEINLV